ncbi:MAG: molybdopterin dinucleotide binding domain-containing protein [Pseudodesulfovibrio sp.]|uniref:molybdopterin dinucleotide binding domain-containing protein n=1 Tax=Pseudodesulfovibrio sp. TaxID=2035812 RepID=UPI003D0ADC1B
MGSISGLLVTVRTAKQGSSMVTSKHGAPYLAEISTLRIHPDDLSAMGVEDGGAAMLASPHGEVRVTCKGTDVPKGLFFLPLGPVANTLFSAWSTEESGVPNWKRINVSLTPCDETAGTDNAGQGVD